MSWTGSLRQGWARLAGCKPQEPWEGVSPPAAAQRTTAPGGEAQDPRVPPPGEEDLSIYLRRLEVLTRSWSGERLDPGGLLHILNAGGSKPPLIWCYNSEREFDRMGIVLGPDQPLVGMRSLNRVAPTGPERQVLGHRLADHYVRLLLGAMRVDRCTVGGNCQSAAIATRMAGELRRAGVAVDLLLTLDATPPEPYPGRVAMLFGRESEDFNPFLRFSRPQELWQAIHAEPSWTIVPGGHGQYFTDENIGALCAAIQGHIARAAEAPPLRQAPDARLVPIDPPRHGTAGAPLILRAEVRTDALGARRPFHVRALWSSTNHGTWASPEGDAAVQRIEAGPPADLVVPAPEMPGPWTLRLVLCQEDVGPISGGLERAPALSVELAGTPAAA